MLFNEIRSKGIPTDSVVQFSLRLLNDELRNNKCETGDERINKYSAVMLNNYVARLSYNRRYATLRSTVETYLY